MDDLISRAEAVKAICGDCVWYNTASCEGEEWECDSVNKLRSLPSAEPNKDKLPSADRPKGRWEHQELAPTNWTFCSVCGRQRSKKYKWYYCPNCGADMRRGEDDESRSC